MSCMRALWKARQARNSCSHDSWSYALAHLVRNREHNFCREIYLSLVTIIITISSLCLSFSLSLVTLGRGHHMREGVQGFARAALVGGIPCLLASKWNIPIKESIILMTKFYVFMAKNKVGCVCICA